MNTLNVVESVFFNALERGTPEARAAFLDEACAGDPNLRRCVDRLLNAHPKAEGFMLAPAPGLPVTVDQPTTVEKVGTVIGPYKLLQILGEGGFGVVFLAEQTEPVRRKVALKIIKPGMDSKQVVARFEAERQALALMDHPNISRVMDGGTTDSGRPFFVMELVKGVPITEFCDANRLTPRDRLGLFVDVCAAVQHAHQKGIIHRDIKPSNVLVAMYDDKPVVKVIDFGVAKAVEQKLTEQTLFTRVGQVVGTLEYMSPEQASLNSLDVDTRSDVYALGVLLYELLTGSTPLDKEKLRAAGFAEMLRLVREEEPPRPSVRLSGSGYGLPLLAAYRKTESQKLPKLVRGELDWIAMKALEKDRSRRYGTATALAADVQRYLDDEQVEACPPSLVYRASKLARKNRAALTLAGTAAALLLLGVVASAWQALRATRAEDNALANLDTAEQARSEESDQRRIAEARGKDVRRREYMLAMNLVQAAWGADDTRRAAELLEGQKPKPGEEDLRGFEWNWWDRELHQEARSGTLPEKANATAMSGDGNRVAYTRPPEAERVGHIRVVERVSGKELFSHSLEKGQYSNRPVLSRDGRRVQFQRVIGSKQVPEQSDEVWDVDAGKRLFSRKISGSEHSAFDANLERLAVTKMIPPGKADLGSEPKSIPLIVKVYDLAEADAEPVLLSGKHSGRGTMLIFSPDGSRLAAVSRLGLIRSLENLVYVWDTRGELGAESNSKYNITGMAFSPDGKRLAGVGRTQDSALYAAEAVDHVFLLSFADGKRLEELWSKPLPPSRTSFGNSFPLFSPDGRQIAVQVNGVRLFDAANGGEVQAVKSLLRATNIAFDKEGTRLITLARASDDFRYATGWEVTWQEWEARVGTPDSVLPFPTQARELVARSDDGERQAVYLPLQPGEKGKRTPAISIRDRAGKEIHSYRGHGENLFVQFRFSPNGRLVHSKVLGVEDHIWEADTGKLVWSRKRVGGGWSTGATEQALVFSPDGRFLFQPGAKGAMVVRFDDLRELFPVADAYNARFSPDGTRLLTIHKTFVRTVEGEQKLFALGLKLWDVESGRLIRDLPESNFGVTGAHPFSPDSRVFLVRVGKGLEVRDSGTGEKRVMLPVEVLGPGLRAAFSHDGSRVITGGAGGLGGVGGPRPTVVWDLATGKELFRLEGYHWDSRRPGNDLAFSRDGTRIAAKTLRQRPGEAIRMELRMWDGATGHELLNVNLSRSLPANVLLLGGMSFSDDGHRLIVGSSATGQGLLSRPSGFVEMVIDATPRSEGK